MNMKNGIDGTLDSVRQNGIAKEASFDYSALSEEDSKFLKSCVADVKRLYKQTLDNIVCIGRYLIEAKQRLKHGEFKQWVEAEFAGILNYSTAANAMNVAREWEHNPEFREVISKIPLKSLYVVCSSKVPDAAKKVVYESVENGIELTPKEIAEIRDVYRSVNVITSGTSPELLDLLVSTALADSPKELKKLSRLPVEKQIEVAEVIAEGNAVSVNEALKKLKLTNGSLEIREPTGVTTNQIKGSWAAGLRYLLDAGVKANLVFAECPMRYTWLDEGMNELSALCDSLLNDGGLLLAVLGHKAMMDVGKYLSPLEPLHILVVRRQPGMTRSIVGINVACASVLMALAYKKPYRAPDRMLVDLQTVETGIEEGLEQIFQSLIKTGDVLVHVKCSPEHFQIEAAVEEMGIRYGCSEVYTVG